jgi:hypothetical protein
MEVDMASFKILSQHLMGGTEVNWKISSRIANL